MPSATPSYAVSGKTQAVLSDYQEHVAGGFAPLPVAIVRAENATVWDVDEKEYLDFLSMYSVSAAVAAMKDAACVNIAFHSPLYGKLAKRLGEVFGYDKFVGMTSGAEAVDAAVKIARKWAFFVKGIRDGSAHILTAAACYHGVTLSTVSLASKKADHFSNYLPNVGSTAPSGTAVRFGVIDDLRKAFTEDGPKIAAFMIEPIQGSAGIIVPPVGYISEVAALCKQYNVLFIADEIQTGFGRTGTNLSHQRDGSKADLVVLGKALSGGLYPMSGVMGPAHVMDLISPFEIGTTMANNPPGCAAALAALDVLVDEKLAERAEHLGRLLLERLRSLNLPYVVEFSGSGLFLAIVIEPRPPKVTGRRIAALLAQRGVLASANMGGSRVRICPPLTISEEDLLRGVDIMAAVFAEVEDVDYIPGEVIQGLM
ncbi:pyridoxal phosphate-dependent transferase [Exophiala viscosa]|uniref:pyridoxal phosphate-dependent transferase n=1 Tax=Exophiala viscosa TaxID=2486360 RepID=UPI00219F07C7|nr:pyridoxal phosphate-dependent transferase [Exophiala viscosa]